MLETIAIILIILWLLGMVSGYTLGNFIWVLLVCGRTVSWCARQRTQSGLTRGRVLVSV
jgi:hypothetical protein